MREVLMQEMLQREGANVRTFCRLHCSNLVALEENRRHCEVTRVAYNEMLVFKIG